MKSLCQPSRTNHPHLPLQGRMLRMTGVCLVCPACSSSAYLWYMLSMYWGGRPLPPCPPSGKSSHQYKLSIKFYQAEWVLHCLINHPAWPSCHSWIKSNQRMNKHKKCEIVVSWVTEPLPLQPGLLRVEHVSAPGEVDEKNNLQECFQFHFQNLLCHHFQNLGTIQRYLYTAYKFESPN